MSFTGQVHLLEYGLVVRGDALGNNELRQGEALPSPDKRASHTECRAHVLRRRTAGEHLNRARSKRKKILLYKLVGL